MKNKVYNPGDDAFRRLIQSEYYIDKTDLIFHLNENCVKKLGKYIFASRPRRFGKTSIAEMLIAYYRYSKEKTDIFNDKKVRKEYDKKNKNEPLKYLNEFNIIYLVMSKYFYNRSIENGINKIIKSIIKEFKLFFPDYNLSEEDNLFEILNDIYRCTGRKMVIIIDEWDYVLRHNKEKSKKDLDYYLNTLNTFLKDQPFIALAYVTGILPLKKNEGQSSLNNFDEMTMVNPSWLAKYIGFTNDEVKDLCDKYEKDNTSNNEIDESFKKQKVNDGLIINKNSESNETMEDSNYKHKNDKEINYENIKNWYNGYHLKDKRKMYDIYSPYSIIRALENEEIRNYWNESANSNIVVDFFNIGIFGIENAIAMLLDDKKIKIDVSTYKNDTTEFENRDDILTLFVHFGYLGYDEDKREVYIPNKEIQEKISECKKEKNWYLIYKNYLKQKNF